jgi:hypothetical protein
MLEQLIRSAGQWSDPAVRQQIIEQSVQILAARGAHTWTDSITELNRQQHLSPASSSTV